MHFASFRSSLVTDNNKSY